jgi:putative drug exporter of the RND superfamily
MVFARLGAAAARFRWWVVAAWVVAAGLLNVLVPQLSDVVARDTAPFLPDNAQVMQAYRDMGVGFEAGRAQGQAILVLENSSGLTAGDLAYYARLVDRIAADRQRVVFVQDDLHHPELRQADRSRDGRALYFLVGLRAPVGTPSGDSDATWLRGLLASGRPSDLGAHVTGDTGVIADFQASVQNSTVRTTAMTLLLVLIILLVVYRSPTTPIIPLMTIGFATAVARPLVALLGLHVFKVASFTDTFMLAIIFGAGTDYCLFVISRFREEVAHGKPGAAALATSVRRVGEAISCSAATVVVGGLSMLPAHVSLFSTTGPAIAVAVVVTLIAGLTLAPALIAVGGARLFWPGGVRVERRSRFWTAAAALIARRPRRVLVAALVPLLLLAALYPAMRLTYDERSPQQSSNDSIAGLAALDRHFRSGEVLPDYVLVESGHDLRNARDMASLDTLTKAVAAVPGVSGVRSFTMPAGTRLAQASVAAEAGVVGEKLGAAHDQVAQGASGASRLGSGAEQVSGGAAQLAAGAAQAQQATGQLGDGMAQEVAGLQPAIAGAGSASAGAGQLAGGAAQLAGALSAMHAGVQQAVDGMDQVLAELRTDPGCNLSPGCQRARTGLQQIDGAERSQLLPGLDQAAAGASRIAMGDDQLSGGLAQLRDGLASAQTGMRQLQAAEATFGVKLGQLTSGAVALGSGAAGLGGGAARLAGGTEQLGSGLDQAAAFLTSMSAGAQQAGIDTFYVPGDQLTGPELALARTFYLSHDGHAARLVVFSRDDAFSVGAMDTVDRVRSAAAFTLRGTSLAGARILVAGDAPLNNDLRGLFGQDFAVVATAVLLGVMLVLALLLRSVLAPLYLLISVLLSYAAAMGLTTFVWQDLLHKGAIDWTVGIFAFIMLVSVGADYNIFLMSRVREEVERDPEHGIQRAVARTGAIITSAGVIFAGTFAALMTSPLSNIAEAGFAITCGLLLDTFIVRSFLVPSLAMLLGRANWWPRRIVPRGDAEQLSLWDAAGGSRRSWPGRGVLGRWRWPRRGGLVPLPVRR